MKILRGALAALVLMATPLAARADVLDDHDAAGSLREFVIGYLDRHRDHAFPADPSVTVQVAKTPLGPYDPDGYVIYIKSGGWCGSGGCTTLIVTKVDNRFQPLGFIPATELPIAKAQPRGEADADLVVMARHALSAGGFGDDIAVRLTRQGDTYDVPPRRDAETNNAALETLISAATPDLKLY